MLKLENNTKIKTEMAVMLHIIHRNCAAFHTKWFI